jgi:hypothetical protein
MPYKNPEDRRAYQRQYKRQQKALRAARAQVVNKAYLCVRYPNLKIGSIQFRDCFFITNSWEQQQAIEGYELWGTHIIGWQVEPGSGTDNSHHPFIL